ncbi:MAG: hypothetical protein NVSMB48_00270 [Marmoricola sp.]
MKIRQRTVGIPVAIDATGALFGVEKIVPSTQSSPYQRPLRCPGCGVSVEPVNGYLTHDGAAVDAYFRLAKHHQHALGCRFRGLALCERLSEDHPDVLAIFEEGYELNLEALLAVDSSTSQAAERRHAARPWLTPVSGPTRPSGGGLADIFRIVERFASDVHAQEQFTAVFRGERLTWRDFYFDATSEIKRFHRTLRAEAAPIPRTLVGVVARIYASKSGDTFVADIALRRDHNLDRPVFSDLAKPILPVIRATSRDQIAFVEGDRIAAIGVWHLFGTLERPTLWLGRMGRTVVL